MMKGIIISLGKRYAIRAINELLEKNRDNVSKISETIALWSERLERVIGCLKRINERVSDGKLECDEVDESIREIEALVKGF